MMHNIDRNIYSKDNSPLEAALYVVATPIGNLDDITIRALKVINSAELLLCEDTRVTKKLLNHFGISQKLESYNDHNGDSKIPKIIDMIKSGQTVAIVSDAGTPLISDPGYRLVHKCRAAGLNVHPIPGASSVIAALSAAGVPTDSFTFCGFFDQKKLDEFASASKTLVFFESAKRLSKSLKKISDKFGDNCKVTIAREITKMFEEFVNGEAAELIEKYEAQTPKGEVVMIIERPEIEITHAEIAKALKKEMKTFKLKDASNLVAEKLKISKKLAYEIGLELKK